MIENENPNANNRYESFRSNLWKLTEEFGTLPPAGLFEMLRFYALKLTLSDMTSAYSRVKGPEYQFIDPLISHNKSVISLGSGPDVFRMVHDFPLARTYHMIDSFGWGDGAVGVLTQIDLRIKALSKNSEVEIIDPGFKAKLPERILNDHDALVTLFNINPDFFRDPIIWRIKWKDPLLLDQERFIKFHFTDYNSPDCARNLMKFLPGENSLAGIINTGASLPKAEPLSIYLEKLIPGGHLITELYKRTSTVSHGQLPEGDEYELLQQVCNITHAPLSTYERDIATVNRHIVSTLVCSKKI